MQSDYYVFEDKKYEAAVRNLKATFFDIVFREEAMLKNLEQRIGTEQNDDVRQRMLDLWTKQNASLDQTLGLVENLTNSVKVLDTFISELSEIDEKIVQDILNSANHYTESPKYQEQIQETVQEPVEEQVQEQVQEPVPEMNQNQEVVSDEVSPVEAEPEFVENPEQKLQFSEEPTSEEVSMPEPQMVEESSISEDAVAEEPVMTEPSIEQPIMTDINQDVFKENSEMDANNEFDISPNNDEAFEPIDNSSSTGEATDEPVIIASETPSDVPEMEVVNESNDGSDLPFTVEPDVIEKEEEKADEVVLNDTPLEIPSYDPEDTKAEEEASSESVSSESNESGDLIPLEEPTTEGENTSAEDSPLIIPNFEESSETEETSSDVVESESSEPESSDLLIPNVSEDTEETPVEESTSEENSLLIPMEDGMQNTPIEEIAPQETIPRLEKILRSNKDVQVKAIIVNSAQFNKLASSFSTQEALLFGRGVLSEEIYKHSNSVLTTLVKSGGVNLGYQNKESDKEKELRNSATKVIQEMLEKANQLYKTGQTEEAQKMYDAISEMNKTLQADQSQASSAPAAQPAQPQVAAQPVAQPQVAQQAVVPQPQAVPQQVAVSPVAPVTQ